MSGWIRSEGWRLSRSLVRGEEKNERSVLLGLGKLMMTKKMSEGRYEMADVKSGTG